MAQLSKELKSKIMFTWYEIEKEAVKRANSIKGLTCAYVHIPFTVNGIPHNTACWNIKDQRFDKLIIPVWRNEKVIHIDIMLD